MRFAAGASEAWAQDGDVTIRWRRATGSKPYGFAPYAARRRHLQCLWSAGFIANRSELTRLLELQATPPDPALLLRLWLRYGAAAAEKIAGTLSFILWNDRLEELILLRDRTGSRGLYFASPTAFGDRGGFAASTSLDALATVLGGSREIETAAVAKLLHGQAPPPGRTFFRNLNVLEPGRMMSVRRSTSRVRTYWALAPRRVLRLKGDREYGEALDSLLDTVVGQYLPGPSSAAKDNWAITLTSGMDSNSVAAAVRKMDTTARPLAVTWITPELPQADESSLARMVRNRFGWPGLEIRADLFWPLSTPGGLLVTPEGPFVNHFTEAWDATFEELRQRGVGALFTGLSGDNPFGGNVSGYPDYLLSGRWLRLLREVHDHHRCSSWSLSRILRSMLLRPIQRHYAPWAAALPSPPWVPGALRRRYREQQERVPGRWAVLPGRAEMQGQLRDRMLPVVAEGMGRQAAAFGIQLLHPLLDHRIFEFAARLPVEQVFRAAERKIILKTAMRGRLPEEILYKKSKIYPLAIHDRGLRERETEKVSDLLKDMRAEAMGFVDGGALRTHYAHYTQGRSSSGMMWSALSLEAWLRKVFP